MSVWLKEIQLRNFMNIRSGKISFNRDNRIVGIYGPNGSGKTAVTKAVEVFSNLFSEHGFDGCECAKLITFGENKSTLKFCFDLREDSNWKAAEDPSYKFGRFEYSFSIKRKRDKAFLSNETVSYKSASSSSLDFSLSVSRRTHREDLRYLTEFTRNLRPYEKSDFFPEVNATYEELNSKNRAFFSEDGFCSVENTSEYPYDTPSLSAVATIEDFSFFVEKGIIFIGDDKISMLRGNLNEEIKRYWNYLSACYERMNCSDILKNEKPFDAYKKEVKQVNDIVSHIMPDFSFEIEKDGADDSVKLFSVRNGKKTPLSSESYGIRKLYYLCYCVGLFEYDTFVVVDELDEGLHETLVAYILDFIQKKKKGLFLFTAHNLRPLQILDKRCIFFSTQNPQKRFTNMKNIKKTNSLKESYIRQLSVGRLDKDAFSYEIDQNRILLAFLSAANQLCPEKDDE